MRDVVLLNQPASVGPKDTASAACQRRSLCRARKSTGLPANVELFGSIDPIQGHVDGTGRVAF